MTVEVLAPTLAAVVPQSGGEAEAENAAVQFTRHKFTVDDYYKMLETGILTEADRVELIDGEVCEMSPIDPIHAACIDRLNRLLNRQLGDEVIVRVQNPIRLHDYTEPIPDLALVRERDDFYEQQHPTPSEILLVIEVANTSVVSDRKEKLPRYAAANIPEVWLVNIARRTIEQYAAPAADRYTEQQVLGQGQVLTARAIENLELPIDRIFGN
ncbi:MAG: Uma2 family endonuclease [Caldilineaceae bacterium]